MPLKNNFETEKELAILGEALNETIDLFINDDQLDIKNRGFVLFIVDYKTGVCQMTTSIDNDDLTDLLRYWVKREDDKKKRIIT